MKLLTAAFGKSIETLSKAFFLFLLLQFPEILLTVFQKLLESEWGEKSVWTFFIGYPAFCVLSVIASALTFLAVTALREGSKPKVRKLFKELKPSLVKLSLASVVIGFLLIPAFLLFVPGIYFMALYLFVPFLILEDPAQTITTYMHRSKLLAKSKLKESLLVAGSTFILSLGFYLLSKELGDALLSNSDPQWQGSLGLALEVLVSVFCGLVIDLYLVHFYYEVRDEFANRSVTAN